MTRAGTGKTYASAFAMRELGFKKVLFLVHRGQLARQTKKSYEKVFAKSVSMGLVGAGYHEYEADYVFATVQAIGVGAGQQSRVHCTRLAGQKADNWWLRQCPKVMNLPFKEKIRRADRDNTIDIYISEDYETFYA